MADNGGKHIKKEKKHPGSRIVLAIGGFVLLYFGMQILTGVETISATKVIIDDAITATGCFIRNEVVVEGSTQQTVEQSVQNGQKVKNGSCLAIEYYDVHTLQLSQQSQNLAGQISLLQSAIQSSEESTDTGKLDQLIAAQMQTLAKDTENGMITNLPDTSVEIRRMVMQRAIGSQDIVTLQNELTQLQTQQQSLQQSVSAQTNSIYSAQNGYFCDTVDGYEALLYADKESLETLTVSSLQDKLSQPVQTPTNALGKIVKDFHWYFAMILYKQDIEGLQPGKSISLRFAQTAENIPAKVYAIREDETTGNILVLLEGTLVTNDLLSMRMQTVDIIKGTYTGIKIPKSAIHMVDGKMGVYTLSGTVSNFKEIKPLFSTENFYVIEQGSSATTGVVAQDNIIVKARGLADNKVVKK